ncbi:twitching motility protein PilU [Neisseria sp. HSC-16F19]|nr:twitching motility protein PilU [Neisseria sp. HSC-16F19]
MAKYNQPSSHLAELLAGMVTDYQQNDGNQDVPEKAVEADGSTSTTVVSAPVTVTIAPVADKEEVPGKQLEEPTEDVEPETAQKSVKLKNDNFVFFKKADLRPQEQQTETAPDEGITVPDTESEQVLEEQAVSADPTIEDIPADLPEVPAVTIETVAEVPPAPETPPSATHLTPPETAPVETAPIIVPDIPADILTPQPEQPEETDPTEAALPLEPDMNTQHQESVAPSVTESEKLMSAAVLGEGLAAPAEPHPLVEKMAVEAVRLNASDIFISTGFAPSFKIDSVLTPAPVKALERDEAAKIVFSTMNKAQRAQFAQDLELNYSLQAKNGVRFRVNAYHEQGRIGMVMRRITTEISTVDDLFLPQALKDLSMMPRGLIILAGATGSGKSTSMAAMLDWRNEHAAGHIVTIEDPIEYIHRPKKSIITHREVGIDTLSWSNAVQSAMRQAPDVVCVGEVRNALSLEYAMQLAQTGHLCFFTIHASNASQAVERILNLFPEERHQQVLMDLALNLVCIIGQRLVIKKGGKGRRAIVDLLINTPAMQDYVFKGQYLEMRQLMEKAEQDGMQTFDQDLFNLYCDEIIDYDEALRQAESVNDLRLRIKLYEEGRATEHIFDRVEDLNLM